jgi:hypothetical protein
MGRHKEGEGTLLARVRALLDSTDTPKLLIYTATGIAPNQLWQIQSGKTKDPSVNTIELLYDFLINERDALGNRSMAVALENYERLLLPKA